MKPLLPAILLTIIFTLPSARGHAQENAADSARYARLCSMLQPYNIPFNTALGDSIRYRLHHEKKEKNLQKRGKPTRKTLFCAKISINKKYSDKTNLSEYSLNNNKLVKISNNLTM